MAKKKPTSDSAPTATDTPVHSTGDDEPPAPPPLPVPLGGLEREVEAFLAQRDELARRLAEEIAATEAKLAELKRTAALLFPEREQAPPPAKDRKAKKPALKAAKPRDSASRSESAIVEQTAAAPDHASSEDALTAEDHEASGGAPHEPHLD